MTELYQTEEEKRKWEVQNRARTQECYSICMVTEDRDDAYLGFANWTRCWLVVRKQCGRAVSAIWNYYKVHGINPLLLFVKTVQHLWLRIGLGYLRSGDGSEI